VLFGVVLASTLAADALASSAALHRYFFSASTLMTGIVGYIALRSKLPVYESLKASRAHLRAVLDAIPGYVAWIDRDLQMLGMNEATALAQGRAADGFPEGSAMRALAADLFSTGASAGRREHELRVSGAERHVLLIAQTYQSGRGVVVIAFDISERKRYERELERQKDLVTQVVDHLPVAVFAKSARDGYRFTLWNRQCERTLGIPREAILGKTDYDLFDAAEADYFRKIDEAVMRSRAPTDIPEEWITAPARRFPAHTVKVPIHDRHDEPSTLLGILEDISDRCAREELIRNQQAMLIHASKMSTLGEMSGGIAHEINNPLGIIMGYATVLTTLIKQPEPDRSEMTRVAGRILATVERIAKIVQGLRSFSREASHDAFEPTTIQRIVTDTLELCQQRFKSNGIAIRTAGALTLPIECRPVQISQVLLNLLNNSFDATAEQAGDRWVEIGAEGSTDGAVVTLTVTDSGTGIAPGVAEKILQPFYTTKPLGKGTGLGLSISKGLVESHHGELRYDPTSANTRFVIRLPARRGPALADSPRARA
jgi:PAS domain S-box-containing protein